MKSVLELLQPLGRALMLPIAVLPVAGLLLRLGQPDLLNIAFVAAAGDAIFSNLGLLFTAGVAIGIAKENHGAAGLAGIVCFLVATAGAKALIQVPPEAIKDFSGLAADLAAASFRDAAMTKLGVPTGIVSGLISGALYNRYSTIKLPDYLSFFGGRRFVPIAAGTAGIGLAAILGLGWAGIAGGMDTLSHTVSGLGGIGLFLYGVANRLLIVTGLHHILNNVVWFILGDYHGATGDLKRFFAGDPTAGAFMSGYFPIMMFGLPGACLAMYRAVPTPRRKAMAGLFLSMALTVFLTGVTEPIEFSFMFLAPALFVLHAILTGLSMALMDALHIKLGFGFSAGLFDYLLNFGKASRPLWLLPIGMLYFGLYYGLFRLFIARFDLKTPGREADVPTPICAPTNDNRGAAFARALGGADNLLAVDACTTRLRLRVNDPSAIDEIGLKTLGARGIFRPGDKTLQVVLGPIADQVAGEIRDALKAAHTEAENLLAALGGTKNIEAITVCDSRLMVRLHDKSHTDETVLASPPVRAFATLDDELHIVIGPGAERLAADIRRLSGF